MAANAQASAVQAEQTAEAAAEIALTTDQRLDQLIELHHASEARMQRLIDLQTPNQPEIAEGVQEVNVSDTTSTGADNNGDQPAGNTGTEASDAAPAGRANGLRRRRR
jgi:hypothetical protein